MNKVTTFLTYIRHIKTNKMLVAGAITLALGSILGFTALQQSKPAAAQNCVNDVICGGASSVGDFVNKYNANAAKDLPAIYQFAGLSPNEINRFAQTAKMGTAYKDGRVVVDGKVVATEANSLGRTTLGGKNNIPINIGGNTYHYGSNSLNFGGDSIPAMVMMNPDTHEMEFAALTACGNPVWGKSPKYKCSMLNREQVDRDTFTFSTNTHQENATVAKVVYDFGDGQTETRTNPAEKVTHNYTKTGNYTAKVTVYFNVNGRVETDTRVECTKPVEVKAAPEVACKNVTFNKISRTKYEFTATGELAPGTTLKDGSFDFGDDQSADKIKATGNKVVTPHEYAREGNYTIKATLNFDIEGKVQSKTCEVAITVTPEDCKTNPNRPECKQPECKPNIPVGDSRCEETPATLPSTGPTEMLGSALGLGSIVGAGGYYIRTRRDLLSVIFKR
jgi:PKD repeat protein